MVQLLPWEKGFHDDKLATPDVHIVGGEMTVLGPCQPVRDNVVWNERNKTQETKKKRERETKQKTVWKLVSVCDLTKIKEKEANKKKRLHAGSSL